MRHAVTKSSPVGDGVARLRSLRGPRVSTRSRPNLFIIGDAEMFRPIHNLFRKAKAAKANKAYREAQERYRNAVSRGDSRDQFHAHRALVDANTERLRLEMGR